jgi:hypothetical protein
MFAVGDVVRLVDTYWHGTFNESREDIGKLFVISKVDGRYEIQSFENGGKSAWWDDSQLEFVEHSEDGTLEKLDKLADDLKKKHQNLSFIKDNYPVLTVDSWLKLFDEIGYSSPFLKNGEYYILFEDVHAIRPIFDKVFDNNLDAALNEVDHVFTEKYRNQFKESVALFFNKIFSEVTK